MIVIYILLILLVVTLSCCLFVFLVTDKYEEYIIRIEEANNNIHSNINNKIELLKKLNDITKESDNDESEIKIIENYQELSTLELDKYLCTVNEKLKEVKENNKENTEYDNIEIEINKLDIELTSLKKYYNNIAEKYNKMINFTPYKIVAHIKKYEILEQFNSDNLEIQS